MQDLPKFPNTRKPIPSRLVKESNTIIQDLLESVRQETYEDLIQKIELLVKDLSINNGPDLSNSTTPTYCYYAIHFEDINLSLSHKKHNSDTIYIGFGLDLEMQRTVLGYWLKKHSESPYHFWCRVCNELKASGITSVEMTEFNEQYWLTEAMNQIFK